MTRYSKTMSESLAEVRKVTQDQIVESSARRDAMRHGAGGRRGIDPADRDDDKATDKDQEMAKKNMILQLRKAKDTRGNFEVSFQDGKKQKVDSKIIDALLQAHDGIQKPNDKLKFVAMIGKSYRDMLKVAQVVIKQLRMGEETFLEGFEVEEIDEMKMDDPKLNKIFDKLKKGQTIKLKTSSTISKGTDFVDYIVKSKNTVNKGKVEKVTLVTKGNEKVVKKFLYKRDGKVTFAIGDMAASIDDIKEELDEGKMKDLHGYISKGMSAQDIAKKMQLDVKTIQALMDETDLEEASKEGTVRIIDLGNKGQDKIRKELGVDKLPNKGFQVQVMTKGKFVNQGKPYKTMKDAEKVRNSGQHSMQFDEKYDLYHKTFSGAMQHSYEYSKKKFGIEIDPNEIDDKVATGPAKPKTGKTNSYRLKGKDGKKGIQVQVYNTGKSYELNMYKEEVELDEAAQILAHGGKGQYKVTKNGSNIEIKFKGKVVGTAEFDRGSDSFFVSIKGEKGQKSFDDAQAMADYFAKNKITEDTQLKEDVTMSMGWKTTENSFNQLMKALKTGSNLTKTINLTVKVDSDMRKIEKLLSKAYSHWEDIEQQVGMNLQDGVVDSSLEDRKERYERVMSHYRLKEEEEPEKPDSAKDVEKGRDDKKKTRIAQLQLQIAKATETINKINAQEK